MCKDDLFGKNWGFYATACRSANWSAIAVMSSIDEPDYHQEDWPPPPEGLP